MKVKSKMSHEKFEKLPYLSVKVVKVEGKKVKKMYCPRCNAELMPEKPLLKKGNWINGENLDKIKFPAYCSFNLDSGKCYGEINRNYNEHKEKPEYELSDITEQSYNEKAGHTFSVRYSSFSLKDLIKLHDIHILKGRIVLFEEAIK